MKDTINNAHKKFILPLGTLVIFSLLIWYLGPLIAIANRIPLAQMEKRIYIIAALFLIWLLKFIFLDITPEKSPSKPVAKPLSPEITKKLQMLQGRFQGALDFLKKTMIKKQGVDVSLAHLPWYLLIGPTNAGKTSFLANANINYILSKQLKQGTATSDACDWWITRNLVMVDVPGHYFKDKENPILWKTLLKLINSTSSKEYLNGIIVTLNLPELMKKTNSQQRNSLAQDLKKYITDVRAQFGTQLPFHFVITKCDLLPGFLDFFSESGSDELSQLWGITLPPLSEKEKLLDVVSHRFNVLIKRINKQLIWRLHQERNPNARPCIKDFPLHIERLKEAITTLLKTLSMPDFALAGVYLTSALQPKKEETTSYAQAATNVTHQALEIMQTPPMPTRAYFVKQLLIQGFLHTTYDPKTSVQQDYNWRRRAVYATSIGIIVTAAMVFGHDFQQSIQKAYSIQNDLARYQLYIQQSKNDDRLVKALPLLDALQHAAHHAVRQTSSFENILTFYSNRSQQTATAVYQQALQTIVIPEIKNELEKYLQTSANKNPVAVYTALKAYVMLADGDNRRATFIANTLNKISKTPMNKQALAQFAEHINDAFTNGTVLIELDHELVNQVRKQLVNLPSLELGAVILKNNDTNDSTIGLGTNFGSPPVFVSKQITNRIPTMFTVDHFQKIVNQEIASAANDALKGNWVLGVMTPSLNQPSVESLTTQLRNQYIANYVDIWESQLANIQPFTPKNLLQADEMIQNLTSNNSPLLQLLQTIKQNTAFAPINAASPKIQALNDLLNRADDKQQMPLYQVFVNLRELHQYLQTILTASSTHQAAFLAAAERMQNPNQGPIFAVHQLAEQSPEPLKTWLNTIANQSWGFVLQDAAQYVQNTWAGDVVPTYNQDIANHYPFTQTSREEVGLAQFTRFLGHRGTLAKFYQVYLKPFINDSGEQWSWRTADNRRIPLTNSLLMNLQYAAQIQQAFFPNGDNKLFVAFTLQPIALDPHLKSMTLNINGQQIIYQKNSSRIPRVLTWPGNNAFSHATTIHFTTPKNQYMSHINKGDWSWFKMVANATQNVNSRKELLLNITLNGHSAKYLLFTQGHMNPFLPMNMSRFDLPQELLD